MLLFVRHALVFAAVACLLSLVGLACHTSGYDGSCSVGFGAARCDGNVLVTCQVTCNDSGCDTETIGDLRIDCGEFATCGSSRFGDPANATCVSSGRCMVDSDCCPPTADAPFYGYCFGTEQCRAGRCLTVLQRGAPCAQNPSACAQGLSCLPLLPDGGWIGDSGVDAASLDAGGDLFCQ